MKQPKLTKQEAKAIAKILSKLPRIGQKKEVVKGKGYCIQI